MLLIQFIKENVSFENLIFRSHLIGGGGEGLLQNASDLNAWKILT